MNYLRLLVRRSKKDGMGLKRNYEKINDCPIKRSVPGNPKARPICSP